MTEMHTLERPPEQREPADVFPVQSPDFRALFNAHLDLVPLLVNQISRELRRHLRPEELLAAGREGLFSAARHYDPSREVSFRVYANYRVRGAILDAIRNSTPLPRRAYERLASMEAASIVSEGEAAFVFNDRAPTLSDAEAEDCLDEHLASVVTAATAAAQSAFASASAQTEAEPHDPEEAYSRAELLSIVRDTLGELDEVEGKIVQLMYFEGMTLEQISQKLHMSKPWACRLHTRAISRLTKRLRNIG